MSSHGPVAELTDRIHSLLSGPEGAALFLVAWVVVGGGLVFTISGIVRRRALRTETDLDNLVVRALRVPLFILWVLVGLYLFTVGFGVFTEVWEARLAATLLVVIAFLAAHAVVRLTLGFLERRTRRRPAFRALQGILSFLVRLGLYSLALLLVLDHLGVEITPLLGAFGIGGLAVALALQDTLANFFAGLYLTIDRPLREGDYLEIDGGTFGTIKGYVVDIGWRSVRIRELGNNVFVVPNSRLAAGVIKNYDLPEGELSVLVQCSVAYGSDLAQVEQAVVEVARACQHEIEGAAPAHDPFIRYHTFGDSGIHFSIILRAKTFVDQYLLTHEFIKRLDARFKQDGIVIPFPQRTLHVPGGVAVEVGQGEEPGPAPT